MRFEAIEAIGVGPLHEQVLELAPGLNVIHGVNEAGKSSWHAALIAGWLGLRRARGPHRSEDREFLERFTPWDGSAFVAAVRAITDDGHRYRFRHNLTDLADHQVTDGTNAVVTGQYEHDGTADGAKLLGLTRDIARSTLCVSQADVLGVTEAAQGLQTQLQRAAASANRDGGTAAAALRRLEEFRRHQVGTDRANSTKPLRRAMDQLAEAEQALADAEDEHEQHLALLARRDEAHERRRGLQEQRDEQARALQAAQLRSQRTELAQLRELQQRVDEGAHLPPVASEETCTTVDQVRQRFAERPEAAPDDDEVTRLQQELADLPEAPEGDVEVDSLVADAHDQLRASRDRLGWHRQQRPTPVEAPELGGLSPADLDRHAATLEAPLPAAPETPPPATAPAGTPATGPVLLGAAALLGLAGVGVLAVGEVVGGLVLLVAAVAGAVAGWRITSRSRRTTGDSGRDVAMQAARQTEREQLLARQEQARQALRAAGIQQDDPAVLRTLAEQARAAEQQARAAAQWESEEQRLQEAVETARGRLADTLAQRGVDVGEDVDGAYGRYRHGCRQRAQQAGEAARRDDLQRQFDAARQLAEDRRQRNQARTAAEQQLLAQAHELGFEGDDLDAADDFLGRWRDTQRQLAEHHREVEQARAELEVRLDGDTLEERAHEVERLAEAVGDVEPAEDRDTARDRLARLDKDLEQARADEVRLDGEVANAESRMVPVADARERTEQARAELTRVEELRDVLDITKRHLEDANRRVNQDIAPVLRDAVTAHLPAITRQRYNDVKVNPRELQVTVRTEGGAYRPAQHLSHGTSEQVYLLLRLGLAEHLVVTDETAPLLLDDVTVQFDEYRTRAFLDLCLELAEHRQIVLFTQEREVLEWADAQPSGTSPHLHRLPDPAATT